MNRLRLIAAALFFLIDFSAKGQTSSTADRYPVIPYPAELTPRDGQFTINTETTIVVQYAGFRREARALALLLKTEGGIVVREGQRATGNCIVLRRDTSMRGKEGYHLTVRSGLIVLSAADPAGLFYGIETMRQLLHADASPAGSGSPAIPAVEIADAPAFSWRGMHLDVARHFFSVEYLKKFIDRMALYKLNKLHLHLTDNEGWRIQIKRYPQLTEQGAWRTFNVHDSDCIRLSRENADFKLDSFHFIHRDGRRLYGGYYTQDQMRDVIRYAADRHIDIVPELDMPGHMMTAIALFPYLSGLGGTDQGKMPQAPMCPCNESTFTFAENVYKEIFSLFPSQYVHIGGDEVERSAWAGLPACKELMRRNDMKTLEEIQSYFIRRMDKFFRQHGKRLIGWDEILEGGMDSTAVIMYWRGWAPRAPVIAAQHGNEVIMTPGNPLYFDQWPDKTTLFSVYHFEPVPAGLSSREKEKILGAQANVWTERIPSERRADYMTMPRMTALAEAVWTHRPADYLSYQRRLLSHYERWDQMQIHYRLPDLEGFTENNVFVDSTVLAVEKPLPEMVIHYTTDGSQPGMESPIFPGSLLIKSSTVIRLAAFSPGGNRGDVYTLHYEKESYRPPVNAGATKPGLECLYYEGAFDNTAKMAGLSPQRTEIVPDVMIPAGAVGQSFGLQYRGFISVPETGVYSFFLVSDDGSKLRIDDKTVVDNDGLHSPRESSGQIALQKGLHSLALDFFEAGGGYTLRLQYSGPGDAPSDIPKGFFHH